VICEDIETAVTIDLDSLLLFEGELYREMKVLIIKCGCVDKRRFRENFSTTNPSMNIVAKMKNQKKPELGNV
jgi:hypothetical protein